MSKKLYIYLVFILIGLALPMIVLPAGCKDAGHIYEDDAVIVGGDGKPIDHPHDQRGCRGDENVRKREYGVEGIPECSYRVRFALECFQANGRRFTALLDDAKDMIVHCSSITLVGDDEQVG